MAKRKNKDMMGEHNNLGLSAEGSQAEKFDFDAWFAMRENKIPRQHHKEIIKADFRARGLGQCESLNDFDAALNKYGVKLN